VAARSRKKRPGKKGSRALVLDASVTGAASTTPGPVAGGCRKVLQGVLAICHRMVFSPSLRAEWHRHRSAWSHEWLTSMYAAGKVEFVEPGIAVEHLNRRVLATAPASRERKALEKDLPLLHAALAADGIILSRDETVRYLLARAAGSVPELRQITWVNPDVEEERVLEWLEHGAWDEPDRRLGGRFSRDSQ